MQLYLVKKKNNCSLTCSIFCQRAKTRRLLPLQDSDFGCYSYQAHRVAKERQGQPGQCCDLSISLGHTGYGDGGAHFKSKAAFTLSLLSPDGKVREGYMVNKTVHFPSELLEDQAGFLVTQNL